MRNAKMFEDMLSTQMSKGPPPGTLGHVSEHDKENTSGDVRGLSKNYLMRASSVDSIEVSNYFINKHAWFGNP
jgi:hypothetical protein